MRRTIWLLFEDADSSKPAMVKLGGKGNVLNRKILKILMSLSSLFLLTSVFMLILSTVPGFQNATRDMFGVELTVLLPALLYVIYHGLVVQEDTDTEGEEENLFLKITEAIFVGWFTLEYLIRFVVSPHKVRRSSLSDHKSPVYNT